MQPSSTRRVAPVEHRLDAVVRPPGSKSITNRALVVSSLVREGSVSRVTGPLEADDTVVMRQGLRRLGVMIDDVDDPWLVLGTGGQLTGDTVIDAGASGTTARFLTAVAALADAPVTIDGTARMRQRPIGDLLDALTQLGAKVRSDTGTPPVSVTGPVKGNKTVVQGTTSSQFLSAILMIAPMLGSQVEVRVSGGLVSRPYVTGTIQVMRAFGASVTESPESFLIEPTGYTKAHFDVESDASAAVYPAVAAAIAGGKVVIQGIPLTSTQPDLAVLDVLELMGCLVTRSEDAIVVEFDGDRLNPVDVDMSGSPDGALAVAVACLFANGISRLSGLGTLRVKETDRLSALVSEIRRIGGHAEIDGDTLVVEPGPLHGAVVETYDDHRMAMSFALAGLRVEGIEIADPGCVTKTWPGFFEALEKMCQI
jgi:3-phosphoshikimate 1-carboxyvinyltransferase